MYGPVWNRARSSKTITFSPQVTEALNQITNLISLGARYYISLAPDNFRSIILGSLLRYLQHQKMVRHAKLVTYKLGSAPFKRTSCWSKSGLLISRIYSDTDQEPHERRDSLHTRVGSGEKLISEPLATSS